MRDKKRPGQKQTTYILEHKVLVRVGLETFAKEIPDMAEDDDKNVTYVCREENVIGRVLFDDSLDRFTDRVTRGEPIGFVSAVTKLCVHSRKNLFGSGRYAWIVETILDLVGLVKDCVFR